MSNTNKKIQQPQQSPDQKEKITKFMEISDSRFSEEEVRNFLEEEHWDLTGLVDKFFAGNINSDWKTIQHKEKEKEKEKKKEPKPARPKNPLPKNKNKTQKHEINNRKDNQNGNFRKSTQANGARPNRQNSYKQNTPE